MTEKFCHSNAALFFFSFFIKEQKTCLLQNVSSTVFVSEIFLLLQRERDISLF